MNEIQEIINFIKTDFTESKIELGKDTIKVTTLKNKKTFVILQFIVNYKILK